MNVNSQKILKYALEGKFSNGSLSNCIKELLQNSRRAGAKNVDIQIKNGMLKYKDDGKGIKNWMSVITLGDSDWNMDITNTEDPAGFGLFTLYSMASLIEISSGDNKIVFTPANLINEEYFNNLLANIKKFDTNNGCGIKIKAELKPGTVCCDVKEIIPYISYFYMIDNVVLNGQKIAMYGPEYFASKSYKIIEYKDNKIYIPLEAIMSYIYVKENTPIPPISVIWRGESISPKTSHIFFNATIIIENGSPLDISLPYREEIVNNEKMAALRDYVKDYFESIIKECTDKIAKGIYVDVDASNKYTDDEKIGLLNLWRSGKDIAKIKIFDKYESPLYEDNSIMVYGQHNIKDVLDVSKNFGIEMIGMATKENLANPIPIQYICNENVYSIESAGGDVKTIIKDIPEIKLEKNYSKKSFILDQNIDKPFFIYNPIEFSLTLFTKDKSSVNDCLNLRLTEEALKVLFFYKKSKDNENGFTFEEIESIATNTIKNISVDIGDKDEIAEYAMLSVKAVIKDNNKLKKIKKYIKSLL